MSDDAPLTETAGAVSPESGERPDIPVFDLKAGVGLGSEVILPTSVPKSGGSPTPGGSGGL